MYFSPLDTGRPNAAVDLRPRRFNRRKASLLAIPIAAALVLGIRTLGSPDEAQAGPPPMPTVTVSQPLQRSIVEWEDYVGRFEASQAVEVKPRVSGALQSSHFKDGEIVRKGDLLFVIDPRPFAAALAEAQAREAGAVTDLALARSELARASQLIESQGVSEQEVDALRAGVRSAEAALAAARAQVRARTLDLEFTRVRAPITGRISDRRVDAGNLVAGGAAESATLLTTLYALDPIYFSFDGSEALYLKQRREGGVAGQAAEIRLQDEGAYRWKGRVDFSDNAIDPESGTIRGRVVLPNPDYFLTPGMFGHMRLSSGDAHKALLIPDSAVQTDQARKIVLVVDSQGTVAAKPVELGPRIGTLRAIRSGLSASDRVVIAGVQFAAPGSKVEVGAGRIEPPDPPQQAHAASPLPAAQATLAAR
jgi:membrane fusion protein, multidrug efflux system